MSNIFKFKQFSVNQAGCAMKVNTDGVLLGTLAEAQHPRHILDIGTGTGVIALMLAQKFSLAEIDAFEINESAAITAKENFECSPFADRLTIFNQDIFEFFQKDTEKKYDLIVSNPPFYLQSSKSLNESTAIAKHADDVFFKKLVAGIYNCLATEGLCWLILSIPSSNLVKTLALVNGLFVHKVISIHSFESSAAHREILVLSKQHCTVKNEKFIIYSEIKVYSDAYKTCVRDFLL